jgi:hypothetical protein
MERNTLFTAVGCSIITGSEELKLLVAFCELQVYRPVGIYYILSYSAPSPMSQQPLTL